MSTDNVDTVDKLEAIRDRVLAGWKVAKRAESKQRIKEALDKFIRHFFEVTELTNDPDFEVKKELSCNTAIQASASWEDKAQNFLSGVKWTG